MKKIIKLLFLLCFILILVPNRIVHASSVKQIEFGTNINGVITGDNITDVYKIILPKAGKVDLTLNSYISQLYIKVLDSNNSKINSNSWISNGSEDTPKKWSFSENLEAGTYYIRVEQSSSATGKYNFNLNYTEANTDDIEPNNGTVTSQKVALNSDTIKGYITWNDDSDIYKIEMPKKGKLNLDFNSYLSQLYVKVMDSNGNKINNNNSWINDGREDNPKKWSFSENLESGTYYIKIEQSSSATGKYTFKVNYTEVITDDIEPNNGTNTAQIININSNPINGYISWNDSEDVYKLYLPKDGKVNFNVTLYISQLYVRIMDSDGHRINDTTWISNGREDDPKKWSFSKNLKSGTYYIRVEKSSECTGIYNLNVTNNAGWVQNADGNWSYYDPKTSELKTGWFQDGSTWYYSNSNGIMKTGWLQNGYSWYYLGSNGAMRTGWFQDGQSWYFMNSNGTMKTGWLHQDNSWYFMYSNGVMACNTTIDGCKLGSNGQWI